MKTRNQWLVRFDPSIVAVKQSSIVSQSIPEYNTINWRDTTHFDSEDDYRTGCRNVSHCKQQQSYSGLRSPGRSNSTFWNDSWVQTFHKAVNVNAYQRRSNNVFDTACTVFAACGVSDANWSLCIYIQKGSAFFKYYLKILIRMAIMPHTRAKTELRHGRPSLLHSVINTAKQLGKCNHLSSWCGRKEK